MAPERSIQTVATDTYSPPKYFQIRRKIVGSIQRGELPPGAPVPSENEIIERHQVSNTTARKALLELEKEGWVTRVKGKAPLCGISRSCAPSTASSASRGT